MAMRRSEKEELILEEIKNKLQELGILIWGEEDGQPGVYSKIKVKDGKLVAKVG